MGRVDEPTVHDLLKSRRSHPVISRIEYIVPVPGAQISAADQSARIDPVPLVERMQQRLRLLRRVGLGSRSQQGEPQRSTQTPLRE